MDTEMAGFTEHRVWDHVQHPTDNFNVRTTMLSKENKTTRGEMKTHSCRFVAKWIPSGACSKLEAEERVRATRS